MASGKYGRFADNVIQPVHGKKASRYGARTGGFGKKVPREIRQDEGADGSGTGRDASHHAGCGGATGKESDQATLSNHRGLLSVSGWRAGVLVGTEVSVTAVSPASSRPPSAQSRPVHGPAALPGRARRTCASLHSPGGRSGFRRRAGLWAGRLLRQPPPAS